jgi:hypothetical protein
MLLIVTLVTFQQKKGTWWESLFFGQYHRDKQNKNKQGVCHTMGLPFTLKSMFKAKEELWKFKYFTMQKYNLQKNPLKETKIL